MLWYIEFTILYIILFVLVLVYVVLFSFYRLALIISLLSEKYVNISWVYTCPKRWSSAHYLISDEQGNNCNVAQSKRKACNL